MSDAAINRRYDVRLQLRQALRIFGERRLTGAPQLDGVGQPQDGTGVLQNIGGAAITDLAAHSADKEDLLPLVENLDPWKTRIPRLGRNGWERMKKQWAARRAFLVQLTDPEFPLRVRLDILRAGRQFTPQELIEVREGIEARKLWEHLIAQAALAKTRMINTLTRLGQCDSIEHEGRRIIRSEVRLPCIDVSPMSFVYYVDGAKLPRGVSITNLYGDEVCTNLSVAVGHPVRSDISKQGQSIIGLRYTVEIAATLGIPNLCKFSDLLLLIPASAPPLAFLVGYAQGKRIKWSDLERLPHFLGGGETNGGKSNMMHVMICSLVSRNTTETLRLLMIDLKFSGIELTRYEGLPHLITKREDAESDSFVPDVPNGVAVTAPQAIAVLQWALDEAERRGRMFTRSGARDLRQWNQKHPRKRLPYIVIVEDELGALRLDPDPEISKRAHRILQRLLAQGRAAGIHFVAFTQTSGRKVLDELSKINMPGRICFATPDISSSVLFVGDGSARGLTPTGRGVFAHGTDRYLVQTPLILTSDIAEIIGNARQGKLTTRLTRRSITAEEIIDWAVQNNESNLAFREVWAHFGTELERIEKDPLLALLKEMDNQEFILGDRRYRVLPGIGSLPRKVITITVSEDGDPVAPESPNRTPNTNEDGAKKCKFCDVELADPFAKTCPKCGAPL